MLFVCVVMTPKSLQNSPGQQDSWWCTTAQDSHCLSISSTTSLRKYEKSSPGSSASRCSPNHEVPLNPLPCSIIWQQRSVEPVQACQELQPLSLSEEHFVFMLEFGSFIRFFQVANYFIIMDLYCLAAVVSGLCLVATCRQVEYINKIISISCTVLLLKC